MNIDKIEDLADRIIKIKIGVANDHDRQVLGDWLGERDENFKLYSTIMSGDFLASRFMMEDELEQIYDLNKVKDEIIKRLRRHKNRKLSSRVVSYSVGVAASLILLFLGAKLYEDIADRILLAQNAKERKEKSSKIKPVSNEDVILITDSGEKIALRTEIEGVIANTSAKLDAKKADVAKIAYNTILTPKGTNYTVILSDGSKVWINENSKLIYPVNFGVDVREVSLEGEAYFEVEENQDIPFIVTGTNHARIRVLGTKFNVNCGTEVTSTTLVEGSVEVASDKTKIIIKPSQQAVVSEGKDQIEVADVDVRMFTSWKEGKYFFKNEPISTIAKTLSEWYGVQFVFDDNDTSLLEFTGTLHKNDSFDNIIDILEATKLFEVRIKDSNVVKLYKKR